MASSQPSRPSPPSCGPALRPHMHTTSLHSSALPLVPSTPEVVVASLGARFTGKAGHRSASATSGQNSHECVSCSRTPQGARQCPSHS
eukprot:5885949-Pleurochrysis_carterae.AAC.3